MYGQHLFVDGANQMVIAKLSSHAKALDTEAIMLTMRSVAKIRCIVVGR